MPEQPPSSPEELILAMLRDVLARQAKQMGLANIEQVEPRSTPPAIPQPPASPPPPVFSPPSAAPQPSTAPEGPALITLPLSADELAKLARPDEPLSKAEKEKLAEFAELASQPVTGAYLSHILRPLAIGLLVILIVINLPLFNGLALARALPDRQALIIRDGLLLKGSGPEVYVIKDNHKRWVSSLDAFQHYGYVWDDVHIVDDSFLKQFPDGRPLHVLLKCEASPHIYRLENDQKRWIKDIPTFTAEGHVWEDVRFVSCDYLRRIPNGPPIPPDAGPSPQP